MTTATDWRWPAEWEPQDAVLLAWPHAETDWAANLADVQVCYLDLVRTICRFQTAVLIVPDAGMESEVRARLGAQSASTAALRFVHAAYDDTWLRDSGPVTLTAGGNFLLSDFRFTGWGGKFEASRDDLLVSALQADNLFQRASIGSWDFALEGGAIDGDGAGTVLTTWHCLHERHPALDRDALSERLTEMLHASRVLMLEHGELQGDDTDAHIDTLARFASVDSIVFQSCTDPDDAHYAPLAAMANEIADLRTIKGGAYRMFALPWPRPIHAADGRRLAASYANFLIVNGAVLMPAYGDAADSEAVALLAQAFPGREIVAVPCRALIEQNGSLHCITMQLPRGVLNVES